MAGVIKTVVVLVQENRSFDHMLGWLKSVNPEINGVTGSESNPLSTADPSKDIIHFGDTAAYVDPDPGHSIQDIYEQVYGKPFAYNATTPVTPPDVRIPPMNGFAQNAKSNNLGPETVMNGFLPDAVPVYRELAASFAVCDRWFASMPASTQPNRLFVHSATSHGLVSNDGKKLAAGIPQKTIFDSLHDAGKSFGIYFQQVPSTIYYRNLRQVKYIGNFHDFDLSFKKHCKEGKLPNYVVIEPRYFDLHVFPANDDHPSHDVSEGQKFVKEVYEALRSSPQWHEMLFVITYDEHGGFFDHVPTPVGVPSPDDISSGDPFNFKFDRLGVRVPTFFISPYIEPGTVVHKPSGPQPTSEYEHSSIPATVKKIFGLQNFLTKRDAWAGTFDGVLTRSTPRTDCPETLPEAAKLRATPAAEHRNLSDFQTELVQLSATIKGDHQKHVDPGMTVAEAAKYCKEAFCAFEEECKKCMEGGADGSYIPNAANTGTAEAAKGKRSFVSKLLSCIACGKP